MIVGSQEYNTLHKWISYNKTKYGICEHCSSTKKTYWANKSHKYSRDLNDWLELCGSCHKKYDRNYKPSYYFAECINCNNFFTVSPSRIGKKVFCSSACYSIARFGLKRNIKFLEAI